MSKYDNDVGNANFNQYFKFGDADRYKLPKEDGWVKLDILSYKSTSKDNPHVVGGSIKLGEEDVGLSLFLHKDVGFAKQTFVCPYKTYGGARGECPICSKGREVYKSQGQDAARPFWSNGKILLNVVDVTNGPSDKVLVFEASPTFWGAIIDTAKNSDKRKNGESIVPFAENDVGFTVKFRVKYESKKIGDKMTKVPDYKDISFEPRSPGVYKGVTPFSLDSMMQFVTGERLSQVFNGEEVDDFQDDVPDETPVEEAPPAAPTGPVCPNPKGTFGDPKSNDQFPECSDTCNFFRECFRASRGK